MNRLSLLFTTALLALLGLSVSAASALAGPVNRVVSISNTTAAPGGTHSYYVTVLNVGDVQTPDFDEDFIADEPRFLEVTLPEGITASGADSFEWDCSATDFTTSPSVVSCTNPNVAHPNESRVSRVRIDTDVAADASGVKTASFVVTGGEGAPGETVDSVLISDTPQPFGVDAFDGLVSDGAGGASTAAGAHPHDITTSIFFSTFTNSIPTTGSTWPVEPTKDIVVDLPVGFAGLPNATGEFRCTLGQLSNGAGSIAKPLCPPGSQVGVAEVFSADGLLLDDTIPIFNMVPPSDVPARFGFNASGTIVSLDGDLRSGSDYGLTVSARNLSELAISGTKITFWGVPADSSHDLLRACPGEVSPGTQSPGTPGGFSCRTEVPRRAFLRNSTSCTGPQATALHIDSWVNPGAFTADGQPDLADPVWESASFLSHDPPGFPYAPGPANELTGCDQVPFEPSITVRATSHYADSPSGLDVDLAMPQSFDPEAIGQADVKDSRVSLPEGMVVNAAAAAGLVGCSQTDVGLNNAADSKCPDASRIGTVEIESPQIPGVLEGPIYQAKQFDNPGGHLLGFYTVAKGSGVIVKLAAHVERDPNTGRLTTVFEDSPQLPFDHYRLHFNDGPRAPLINPPTCGTKTTNAVFTSWARPGEEVALTDTFQITSGPNGTPCPNGAQPFDPNLTAGLVNPTAGATSPFVIKLTRSDGEQRFRGLTVSPPEGLSAYLKGVPYCPEAALDSISAAPGTGEGQIASPSCPAASQIGTVSAGTGAGPIPFHVNTGKVYLAGPYRGAPLSLAIAMPAVAGPIDLGTVVVRSAVHVDPTTAKLSVVSDPIPLILEGIPLSIRSIYLVIDRPDFTVAPTSCERMSVDAAITGSDGAAANPSSPFQVGGCSDLGFKPHFGLRLLGGTKRGAHPKLRAVLQMPQKAPQANIARTAVTLPSSALLDQGHINTVCTRVQYAADQCPAGSIYGYARAFTPLLDQPLEGPVYLRSSDHKLPDLVAALHGQIDVDLAGRIDSVRGGIRTTFDVVPDAPVSKFALTMKGGAKGLLQNSRALCARTSRAVAKFDAHSGKIRDSRPLVKNDCAKRDRGKRGDHGGGKR